MRNPKLQVDSIREILQLRSEAKAMSIISKKLGISKSTVHNVVKCCQSVLDKGCLISITDSELLATVYPKEKSEPNFDSLLRQGSAKKASGKALHELYLNQVSGRAYEYSSFMERYNDWLESKTEPSTKDSRQGILYCEYVILQNANVDIETGELRHAILFLAQQSMTDNALIGICNKNDYSTLYAMLVHACNNANESVHKVEVRFHNSVFNSIQKDLPTNFKSLQNGQVEVIERVSRRSKSHFKQLIEVAQTFKGTYDGNMQNYCSKLGLHYRETMNKNSALSLIEVTAKDLLVAKTDLPLTRLKTFKVSKAQLITITELRKVISVPMELTGKKVQVAYNDERAIIKMPNGRTIIHHFNHTDNSYYYDSGDSANSSKYYINPEHIPVTKEELSRYATWIPTSLDISKSIDLHFHRIISELIALSDIPQRRYSLVNYLINKANNWPAKQLGNICKNWLNDQSSKMHVLLDMLERTPHKP